MSEEYIDFDTLEIHWHEVAQESSFFNKIDVFREHVCKHKC